MSGAAYSGLTYVLLVAAAAPLIAGGLLFDTIDWTPWLVLLAVGVALAWLFRQVLGRMQARVRGAAAAQTGLAPEHAPGGGFVWLAVPAWTIGLGLCLNRVADGSPPEEHASEVVQLTNGKTPRITIRDFRPGGDTISFRRSGSPIAGARVGQAITVVAHRGLFGWAWIATIR